MKKNAPQTIFIIDDHPVFREGLKRLIEQTGDLAVCGQAAHFAEAIAVMVDLKPELALVDIGLPGRDGLELVRDIQNLQPETGVLVVSMHDETLYAERVLRAGGRGYIMKHERPDRILQAIRSVLGGQIYLSRRMSAYVLDAFSGRHDKTSSPINPLTHREREVLQWVGQGEDRHTIAERLHLSSKTVDAHRTHIKEKLGLKNHTELISYAARCAADGMV